MPPDPSATALPSRASVVVIGGGVMGCSTLYHLARAGVGDAVLLERNRLTSGTTWHSAAQVRALRSSKNLTDLIRYSIDLYRRLEAETGQATGWIGRGSLSIATSEDRMTHIKRQQSLAQLFGVRAQTLSAGQARERWPLMRADDVIGAVWSPDDGRVGPSDLCAALARGARAGGATIFEDTAVTGIVTDAGKVVAVETAGGPLRCDAVAVCAGLWSRQVAALAGVAAPVWPCEHFYLLTRPVDGIDARLPTLSDHDGHLYIRDEAGGLLIGCFEPLGKSIDPQRLGSDFAFRLLDEDWAHFEPMMENALHRLPALHDAEIKMLLNGPESFTPDGAFLLGEAAETRGLFLGCGMNSVGVASGGGAGMALAHCIVHGAMPSDLSEVDPARFPDCFQSAAALSARAPEVLGKHYEISYPGRQMNSARRLRAPPLYPHWQRENAYFGQVFGWERPLYFSCERPPRPRFGRPDWFRQVGIEVARAHRGAALFDQSTLGKLLVEGADAEAFLNRVCANDLSRPPGRVVYTVMLNPRGGVRGDLTVLRLDAQRYRLYTGSGAVKRDLAWLRRQRGDGERVRFHDQTETLAVLALTGPRAAAVAAAAGAPRLAELGYYRHASTVIGGVAARAARLSYVGEDGWELTLAAADADALYRRLYAAGARPCGLYAQTSMRIEKRYPAYGYELDSDVSPLQAGLGFSVDWRKDFIGRAALLRRRAETDSDTDTAPTLVTLLLEDQRATPLGNEPVYCDDVIVGSTTSAAYGYRLGRPVALAYLRPGAWRDRTRPLVTIDIAGAPAVATALRGAAFDPQGLRLRPRAAASR